MDEPFSFYDVLLANFHEEEELITCLYWYEKLSVKEIAHILEIPQQDVWTQVELIRQKTREFYASKRGR